MSLQGSPDVTQPTFTLQGHKVLGFWEGCVGRFMGMDVNSENIVVHVQVNSKNVDPDFDVSLLEI